MSGDGTSKLIRSIDNLATGDNAKNAGVKYQKHKYILPEITGPRMKKTTSLTTHTDALLRDRGRYGNASTVIVYSVSVFDMIIDMANPDDLALLAIYAKKQNKTKFKDLIKKIVNEE